MNRFCRMYLITSYSEINKKNQQLFYIYYIDSDLFYNLTEDSQRVW